MKNIKYFFIALSSTLLLNACGEEEAQVYKGSDLFHFLTESSSTAESAVDPIEISVVYTKTSAKSGDVNFEISSDNAVAGEDYLVVNTSNTLSYGTDEYTATIKIQPIDNIIADGSKVLTVRLTNGSEKLGFDGSDALFSTHTLTITDDDCPLDLEAFVATNYTVVEEGYGEYTPTLALDDTDPNVMVITNLGDWKDSYANWGDTYVKFNEDGTLKIIPTPVGYTAGGSPIYWVGSGNAVDGSHVACTKYFEVTYGLVTQAGGVIANPVKSTFTPN
jgi:hypothetical protein